MDDQATQNDPMQMPQQQALSQPAAGQQGQRPPLRIDDNLLQELGLGTLPQDEKTGLLKHIYETLEMRVGMRLADQMTNEQLDEFETFYNAKDDAGAFQWLESNFPNYKDIVAEEFAKLKGEVSQNVPQILQASQDAGIASAQAGAQPQPIQGAAPSQQSMSMPQQQQSQNPQAPQQPSMQPDQYDAQQPPMPPAV